MITINSTSIVQPSRVREGHVQIQHDNQSIDGSRQRNRFGQKRIVELEWKKIKPADYQQLLALFTTGAAVTYTNTLSADSGGTMSFVGLPDIGNEGDYIDGASLIKPFMIVINEV